MTKDTFWSDTMNVTLSSSKESSIEGPHAVIDSLATHLTKQGHKVTRIEESHKGTDNIHSRKELFLEGGANPQVVSQLEALLAEEGVRFTKHTVANDPDYIDLSYDLNNVSVWKG